MGPERPDGLAGDRLGSLHKQALVPAVPPVGEEAVLGEVGVQARVGQPVRRGVRVPGDRAAVAGGLVHPAEYRDHRGRVAGAGPAEDGRRRGVLMARHYTGVGRDQAEQRPGRDDRGVPGPGQFPAQRPVQRHRRREQRRERVAPRRDRVEQGGHQQAADAPAPVLRRHLDAGHPGHRHRAAAPPLPHVLQRGPGRRAAAGEGAQVPPARDEPGQRQDPPVAVGGGHGTEGPFGQVELGIGIVAGP